MKWRLLLTLATVVFFQHIGICQISQKGIPAIVNFSAEMYNYADNCYEMVQDSRGILHIGNINGLLEYDGVNWNITNIPEGGIVRCMDKNSKGNIVVGGYNDIGFLVADNTGKLAINSVVNRIPEKYRKFFTVWAIHFLDDETFVARTYNYLFIFSPKSVKVINTQTKFSFSKVINKKLFVFENNKGLQTLENGTLKSMAGSDVFLQHKIAVAIPLPSNQILFATNTGGFIRYKEGVFAAWKVPVSEALIGFNATCGILSQGKYLVLGSSNKGLLIADSAGNVVQRLTKEHGLLSNFVGFVLEDASSKNLWVSSDLGYSFIETNSPLFFLNESLKFSLKPYTVAYSNSKIYFGGAPDASIFNWDTFNYNSNFDFSCPYALKNGSIYGIKITPSEVFYSGLAGLYCQDGNTIYPVKQNIPFYTTNTFWNEPNYAISMTEEGCYISKKNNKKWLFQGKLKGINLICYQVLPFKKNEFWLLTAKGFYSMKVNDLKDSVVLLQPCVNHFGLPSDNSYIFGMGGKYYALSNCTIYEYSEVTGAFVKSDRLCKLVPTTSAITYFGNDGKECFWFSYKENNKTVYSAINVLSEKQTLLAQSIARKLSLVRGLSDAFCSTKPSEIVLGYNKGAVIFNPLFSFSRKAYNTIIRKVQLINSDSIIFNGIHQTGDSLFSQQQLASKIPTLTYKNNSVRFVFASLYYENVAHNKYSYKLEGFDNQWSDWNSETKKEYTNLPNGTFTFMVKSQNIYGTEGTVASYTIRVLPPFWKTWWFVSIVGLVVFGAALLFYRIKTQVLMRQKLVLEQKVAERTHELQTANLQLTQQQNEIIQQNEEIRQQAEELQAQSEILASQNEKLVELDKFKESITGSIVHDLKNPLNSIIVLSELMQSYQESPEDALNLRMMNQSGKQMLQMVMNILDVQKFESARMHLEITPIQIPEIVNQALEQVSLLIEQKEIEIINTIPQNLMLQLDNSIMVRVFTNLLTNAIKFTNKKGKIRFNAEANSSGKHIKISVQDTGCGISETKLPYIFEKFSQAEARDLGKTKSTGLGLNFCKMAVEAHSGKIWVESVVGVGTTFFIELPIL